MALSPAVLPPLATPSVPCEPEADPKLVAESSQSQVMGPSYASSNKVDRKSCT